MKSTNTRADLTMTRAMTMTSKVGFSKRSYYDDAPSVSEKDLRRFEDVFSKHAKEESTVAQSQLKAMLDELDIRLTPELMDQYITAELIGERGAEGKEEKSASSVRVCLEDWLRVLSTAYAPAYNHGEQLGRAAARGDVAALKELVCRGCHPNAADGRGYTALHFAAEAGKVESIKALREVCPALNIDHRDATGWTPLIAAAANGHEKAVRALRSLGAAIDAATNEGRTALHWACTKGKHDVVHALLNDGSDKNAADRMGWTPLHCAIVNGDANIITALIEANVNLDCLDHCGRTSKTYCDDMALIAYETAVGAKNAPTGKKGGKRGRRK